jgi:biopolymer transport protein ExbD/biopolymer transport protein TolR
MRFSAPRRPDPLIDVTPMIDIVFQLVLFFMVSTTFVNAPGIQVDLPRSSAQMLVSDKTDLNVWMTCAPPERGGCAQGSVYVDDQPVTVDALRARFVAAAERDPDTLVVIKADEGVPHGRVVAVMDAARERGLSRLAIATEVVDEDP